MFLLHVNLHQCKFLTRLQTLQRLFCKQLGLGVVDIPGENNNWALAHRKRVSSCYRERFRGTRVVCQLINADRTVGTKHV